MVHTGSAYKCTRAVRVRCQPFGGATNGIVEEGNVVIVSFLCKRTKKARVVYPVQGYVKISSLEKCNQSIGALLKRSRSGRVFLRQIDDSFDAESTTSETSDSQAGAEYTPAPASSAPATQDDDLSDIFDDSDSEDEEEEQIEVKPVAVQDPYHGMAVQALHMSMWNNTRDLVREVVAEAYKELQEEQEAYLAEQVRLAEQRKAAEESAPKKARPTKTNRKPVCGFRIRVKSGESAGKLGYVDRQKYIAGHGTGWIIILDDCTQIHESMDNIDYLF